MPKITILDRQEAKNKAGQRFIFFFGETKPEPGYTFWSTIRWQSIFSDEPPPVDWKVGATIDVRLRKIDYNKGIAEFEPLHVVNEKAKG